MDHAQFKANQTAALYVGGRLDERIQESFEMHLMTCFRCLEEVEMWRAMQTGLREQRPPAVMYASSENARNWRLAASLAFIAVGSGAAGWYGHSFGEPAVADDAIAVFNLPPLTRGADDCATLRVESATELVALRVPDASPGRQLVLLNEGGAAIDTDHYSVRAQPDGSWLLRMRVSALRGDLLRLQTRDSGGGSEPLGCVVMQEKG